jgi:hypothetical protein
MDYVPFSARRADSVSHVNSDDFSLRPQSKILILRGKPKGKSGPYFTHLVDKAGKTIWKFLYKVRQQWKK